MKPSQNSAPPAGGVALAFMAAQDAWHTRWRAGGVGPVRVHRRHAGQPPSLPAACAVLQA